MPFIVTQIRSGAQVLKPRIGARAADNATLNDVYKNKKIDRYKKKKILPAHPNSIPDK
jgi:hypothetical protein